MINVESVESMYHALIKHFVPNFFYNFKFRNHKVCKINYFLFNFL